ncbi:GNAT family N-acetyltransferase [Streptomyces spiramyceticus]|uniref:GNAT family N-acetyltransferase n=1 Tax=Streptomyces spiramyceticus TaxID=299717 RepID=UPI00237A5D8E|nr:GNAT family N-acetyltransferase [Streptomyces spiramyceticus]
MIRNATPADLDAIAALHTAARATYYRSHIPEEDFSGPAELARTREGWAAAIARDDANVLCAEDEGTVAGTAAFRVREGIMTLTQLHVAPTHWSRGLGTALHTACVETWQRTGTRQARLEVYEHNLRAQTFYARHGWHPDPETPRVGAHLVLLLDVPPAPPVRQ